MFVMTGTSHLCEDSQAQSKGVNVSSSRCTDSRDEADALCSAVWTCDKSRWLFDKMILELHYDFRVKEEVALERICIKVGTDIVLVTEVSRA